MFFFSAGLTIAAIVLIVAFGLRFGADFKGGSVMELVFNGQRPSVDELGKVVSAVKGVSDVSVSPAGDNGALIRLNDVDEQVHQGVLGAISGEFGKITENRFDSIGPTVGNDLKTKSIKAIIISLLAVVVYLAIVFRKLSLVLSPWALGLSAVMALVHDVLVPVGLFALLCRYLNIEITSIFVAAVLTILGYSISDSVVVFDRIRENVLRFGARENFGETVHRSIMQTLVRSLNTTFTVLLSLIAIFFFGGESIKYFALALIVGVFCGAYSSIFIASPILVWWGRGRK
jgi:preprotein translocase subunit SecF